MPYYFMTHTLANPTQVKSLFSAPFSHSPGFPSVRRKHTLPHSLAPVNKRPAHTLQDGLNQHIAVKGCIRLPTTLPSPYPAFPHPFPLTFTLRHTRQTNFCFTGLIPCKIPWLKSHFISFKLSFQQGKYFQGTPLSSTYSLTLPCFHLSFWQTISVPF